jgi:hypothetical protein
VIKKRSKSNYLRRRRAPRGSKESERRALANHAPAARRRQV